MTQLQLALLLIGALITGCAVIGLLAQRIVRRTHPSSGAVKSVPRSEAALRIVLTVLALCGIAAIQLAPAGSEISELLSTWYGWPVLITLGVASIYAVTFIFTFIRLLLAVRNRDQ